MRIIVFILSFLLIGGAFNTMAHADRYYFYKEEGKQLKKDARFDTYWFEDVRKKFPGIEMRFNLPRRRNNSSTKIATGITLLAKSDSKYFFVIQRLSVRNDKKRLPLYMHLEGMTPSQPFYERITAYESIDGIIQTKKAIEVIGQQRILNSLYPEFYFNVATLPKHLYLDYKFTIRKEDSPEKTFEGTIPLELTHYDESLWEVFWK